MKKELIIAILFGLGIGLLTVFGIITAQTALSEHDQRQTAEGEEQQPASSSPTPSSPSVHFVEVTGPVDGQVVSEESVTVLGKTSPESVVVVTTETDRFFPESNPDGSFRQDVKVAGGVNDIRVVSFSPKDERAEQELTIVYSTADF